jgi:hypothetical protein
VDWARVRDGVRVGVGVRVRVRVRDRVRVRFKVGVRVRVRLPFEGYPRRNAVLVETESVWIHRTDKDRICLNLFPFHFPLS